MVRVWMSGLESGNLIEWPDGITATVTGDNIAVDSSIARSGTYSMKVDYSTTASTGGRAAMVTINTGTANTLFLRWYLYVTSMPTERSAVLRTHNATTATGTRGSVSLNTNGTIQIYNGSSSVGSASTALSLNTWYRIEFSVICNGTNQVMTLQLDGTTVASSVSFANTNADYTCQFGWSATGTAGATKSGTYYIDDLAANYDAGGGQLGFPGSGKLILLLPLADNAVGTGWTTSGAASSNLYTNLDNIPPTGIADTTTNEGHQIRNAANSANSNYDAQVPDYASAGIAAADTVSAVMPFAHVGAPSATSPKSGTIQCVSNPAGSASPSFTFYQGSTIAGTYPTGWKSYQANAAVVDGDISAGNRGTPPVIRVTQVTGSTRIALVCLLGLYVDYVPAAITATAPPPWPQTISLQPYFA